MTCLDTETVTAVSRITTAAPPPRLNKILPETAPDMPLRVQVGPVVEPKARLSGQNHRRPQEWDGEAANSRCQKPAVTGRYIRLKSAYRSAVNIHGFCSPDGQPAIRR